MFFAIDNNDHPLAVKPEDQEESNLDLGEEYTEDKKDDTNNDKKDELGYLDDKNTDKKDDTNNDKKGELGYLDDKNTDKKDDHEDKDEEDDKNSNKDDDEKDNFKAEIAKCELKQSVMYNNNNFYNLLQ